MCYVLFVDCWLFVVFLFDVSSLLVIGQWLLVIGRWLLLGDCWLLHSVGC